MKTSVKAAWLLDRRYPVRPLFFDCSSSASDRSAVHQSGCGFLPSNMPPLSTKSVVACTVCCCPATMLAVSGFATSVTLEMNPAFRPFSRRRTRGDICTSTTSYPHPLFSQTKQDSIAWNNGTGDSISSPSSSERSFPRAALFVAGSTVGAGIAVVLPSLFPHTAYMLLSNILYLWRRSSLRRTTMWEIFRIRTMIEPGVTYRMFLLYILAWQFLVAVFPLSETVARFFGYASFFYSYPNAAGGGYILEPLAVQDLPGNKRAKQQLRLDWHRFKYNVGNIGKDGYRHPPTVERNLPHLDVPEIRMKHWPWRRRHLSNMPPRLEGQE